MEKKKPSVGDTLFSLNIGNAARNCEQVLTPVVVTKVGRRYFYTEEGWSRRAYHLSDWREKSNYTPNSELYATRQSWEDEKARAEGIKTLGKIFWTDGGRGLSNETIAGILQIIDEDS
jgi:hypothetical protein